MMVAGLWGSWFFRKNLESWAGFLFLSCVVAFCVLWLSYRNVNQIVFFGGFVMAFVLSGGWYVSRDELMENGYGDTRIFCFNEETCKWSVVGTGEVVSETELPVSVRDMWRVALVTR